MKNKAYGIVVPTYAKTFLKMYFTELETYEIILNQENIPKEKENIFNEFGNIINNSSSKKRKKLFNLQGSPIFFSKIESSVYISQGNFGFQLFFSTKEEAILQKKIYLNKLRKQFENHLDQVNGLIDRKIPHDFTEEIQNALNGE
jgi:hypothetical protein